MFARFVPDEIKLDMELARDFDRDPRRQAIFAGSFKCAPSWIPS